jgi:hypothetical protein
MKTFLSKHLKRINYSYLRSVLFPEFSKGARFPTKFHVTSNTYQVRSTFTLKINEPSIGILFDPITVSN